MVNTPLSKTGKALLAVSTTDQRTAVGWAEISRTNERTFLDDLATHLDYYHLKLSEVLVFPTELCEMHYYKRKYEENKDDDPSTPKTNSLILKRNITAIHYLAGYLENEQAKQKE